MMLSTRSNLNVILEKRGPVTLRQTNYVTTGGEASIYRLSDTIVKIFTDPNKMTTDRMSDKIGLLAGFSHPFIINPQGLVTDKQGKPLGYYMGFVDGEPFSRVFTTAFRQRTGFDDNDAIQLVHNMREVLLYAHPKGAVLGDANELNWLMVKPRQVEPRVVDVDSWQIGQKWPLRVIMPSIRDYHTKDFTENSDWFSWGIVSFQIFSGIHPYKGRHDGYKTNELERRMRDNVSVFHQDVRVNAVVRDFNNIPGRLLAWYRACFDKGERTVPPSPLDRTTVATAARTLRQTVDTTGAVLFEKLLDGGSDPIVRVFPSGIVVRASGELSDLATKRKFALNVRNADIEIVQAESGYLVGLPGNLFFHLTFSIETGLSFGSRANKLVRNANRLFAVTHNGLSEVKLIDMGKLLLTIGNTWPTLPLATEWFSGFGVQNSLGAKYLVLPFGDDKVDFVRAKELDDVTVITGRAGHRFVSIIALDRQGQYHKYELTFDRDYRGYSIWIGDAESPDLNLAILPNGVCATIVQDGELTIFVPTQQGGVRKIADRTIATDMQLGTIGDKVVYLQNGDLWRVSVK